jgi:hypothetical protein
MKRLANLIGSRYLSFQNPRVVSPPGTVESNGRRNIVVATPMRCGTHVMIDAILNNIPAYCRRPLYVDLDQFCKRGMRADAGFGQLDARSGYVLKTHFPLGFARPEVHADRIAGLARDAFVIRVERDAGDIRKSLAHWAAGDADPTGLERYIAGLDANLEAFHAVWQDRCDMTLRFEDLFDANRMTGIIAQIARETGSAAHPSYRPMPARRHLNRIYVQKALTRLLGCNAPQINMTIHVSA